MATKTVKLTKDTKEYYPVKLTDALKNLTDLTGKDLRFDLFTVDDDDVETEIETNLAGAVDDVDPLIALALIDAKGWNLEHGTYAVYFHFTLSPEAPRLGPFYFTIDD